VAEDNLTFTLNENGKYRVNAFIMYNEKGDINGIIKK
jgi:hypothetical protein